MQIKYCVFENINCSDDGAGCNIKNHDSDIEISNSYFENCRCKRKGGAVYIEGKRFTNEKNCFHLCRCGSDNGNDGSTVYAQCDDFINTTFVTCHQCPRHGEMCWYGIMNMWKGDLTSKFVNISSSETEFVCSLAHCEPARKKSVIKYYTSINGKSGNALTFVGIRFEGEHKYGNIVNNSVKSGLIYFQDSQTVVSNYYFKGNSGALTYSCVGVSKGVFEECVFDRVMDKGNGFDMSVSCSYKLKKMSTLEFSHYNSYICGMSTSSFSISYIHLGIGIGGMALLFVTLFGRRLVFMFNKLIGRRHK